GAKITAATRQATIKRALIALLSPASTMAERPAEGAAAGGAARCADGSRVLVVPFVVNNNPEARDRSRRRFRTAAGWCFLRVPGAAQHERSEVMRCRPGTVAVCGGPGSAVHRSTSLRAAPRPGHAIASHALLALFTFQTAHLVPAAQFTP